MYYTVTLISSAFANDKSAWPFVLYLVLTN